MSPISIKLDSATIITAGVALVALYFVGKAMLPDVVQAVDPLNDKNIFNQWADRFAVKVLGAPNIGEWIYDKTHGA